MNSTGMNRRSFLQRLLSLAPWIVAPSFLHSIMAQTARAQSRPKSLRESLATQNREIVARFILASPSAATGAQLQDRAQALRLMTHGTLSEAEVTKRTAQRQTCENPVASICEQASVVLVRHSERNRQELQAYVNAVGGRKWLQAATPGFKNAQLRQSIGHGFQTLDKAQ